MNIATRGARKGVRDENDSREEERVVIPPSTPTGYENAVGAI